MFSLRLPAFGAGDESERRWRCGCRCLDLERSVSLRGLIMGSPVPVASPSGRKRHGAN